MIKSCIIHYFIFIYYFCEWAKDNKYYENGVLATPAYSTITESNGVLEVTGDYKEIANDNGTTLYLETLDVTESNGVLTINSNHAREIPNEKGTTLYI